MIAGVRTITSAGRGLLGSRLLTAAAVLDGSIATRLPAVPVTAPVARLASSDPTGRVGEVVDAALVRVAPPLPFPAGPRPDRHPASRGPSSVRRGTPPPRPDLAVPDTAAATTRARDARPPAGGAPGPGGVLLDDRTWWPSTTSPDEGGEAAAAPPVPGTAATDGGAWTAGRRTKPGGIGVGGWADAEPDAGAADGGADALAADGGDGDRGGAGGGDAGAVGGGGEPARGGQRSRTGRQRRGADRGQPRSADATPATTPTLPAGGQAGTARRSAPPVAVDQHPWADGRAAGEPDRAAAIEDEAGARAAGPGTQTARPRARSRGLRELVRRWPTTGDAPGPAATSPVPAPWDATGPMPATTVGQPAGGLGSAHPALTSSAVLAGQEPTPGDPAAVVALETLLDELLQRDAVAHGIETV